MAKMITKVIPGNGYVLDIYLSGGSSIKLDMSGLTDTMRFYKLKDKALFNAASIDDEGSYVVFGDDIRIGAREIINIALMPGKEDNGK